MTVRRLVKACSCYPMTASGPRLIFKNHVADAATIDALVEVVWIELACDVCDTPWVEAEAGPSPVGDKVPR